MVFDITMSGVFNVTNFTTAITYTRSALDSLVVLIDIGRNRWNLIAASELLHLLSCLGRTILSLTGSPRSRGGQDLQPPNGS